MNVVEKKSDDELSERLNTSGFRFTPQRQHVYDVLLHKRDHPTAEEVFIRAKKADAGDFPRDGLQLPRCAGEVRAGPAGHAGPRRDALLPEHGGALPLLLRFVRRRFSTWRCRTKPQPGMPCRKVSRSSITKSRFTAFARIARRKNDGSRFNNLTFHDFSK